MANNNYYTLSDGTRIYNIEIQLFINHSNENTYNNLKVYYGFHQGTFIIRTIKKDKQESIFNTLKGYDDFKKWCCYEQ
tara:strand:+ start:4933 stop:5166 length:234 start_codon:yes stop_codon:yes gene_type:complete